MSQDVINVCRHGNRVQYYRKNIITGERKYIKKKDKIAKGTMETLLSRNLLMSNIPEFKGEFKGYSSESHIKLMEYALKQGYKEIYMKFFT